MDTLIPPAVSEIFADPPLVRGEGETAYQRMVAQLDAESALIGEVDDAARIETLRKLDRYESLALCQEAEGVPRRARPGAPIGCIDRGTGHICNCISQNELDRDADRVPGEQSPRRLRGANPLPIKLFLPRNVAPKQSTWTLPFWIASPSAMTAL